MIFLSAGATNFRDFIKGDAVGIASTERLGAAIELFSVINKAIQSYNRANPTLQVPVGTLDFGTENKSITGALALPYSEVALNTYECARTIQAYLPAWTVPTTGELIDCASQQDALVRMFRNVNNVARLVEVSALYNSPVDFLKVDDNGSQYSLSINTDMIYAVGVDGSITMKADNWADIVDKQQALV
jgi:hypothetical protein